MENKEVIFVTEKGTFFVTPSNSKYVSTLLSMYDHTTIPGEVLLKGAVGEAVDDEYEAMYRLLRRSSILSKWQISERMSKMIELSTIDIYDGLLMDEKLDRIPPTYLSDVARLSRIFDLQDSDHIGLLVDERSTQVDRIAHYKIIGRLIRGHPGRCVVRLVRQDPLKILMYRCSGVLKKLLSEINGNPMNDDYAEFIYPIVAVLYVALLRYRDGGYDFLRDPMMWDDLSYLIDLYGPEDGLYSNNTLRLYAGKGDLYSHIHSSQRRVVCNGEEQFLLEAILKHMPEDVNPSDLGLGPIINGTSCISDDQTVRNHVIIHIGFAIGATYAPITLNRLGRKVRAKRLQARLGKYVISRIRSSLQHYEKAQLINRETRYFLRTLERLN